MNSGSAKWIGLFVSSGLVALVGLVLVFGGGKIGSKSEEFVLFFDQSVNGLNPGATVKFRGVPIGQVSNIALRVEGQKEESSAVAVVISIDARRLQRDLGIGPEVLSADSIQRSVERGLTGRLTLESFITGLLFVELDFVARDGWVSHLKSDAPSWLEIPTMPSPIDQLTNDVVAFIGGLDEIDLGLLAENLSTLFGNVSDSLAQVDFASLSTGAIELFGTVSRFVESDDVAGLVSSLSGAAEAFAGLAIEAKVLVEQIKADGLPLGEGVDELIAVFQETAEHLTSLVGEGRQMLGGDSDFRVDLETALRELSRTARSFRNLAELIERDPRSVLSGRELMPFRPDSRFAPED